VITSKPPIAGWQMSSDQLLSGRREADSLCENAGYIAKHGINRAS